MAVNINTLLGGLLGGAITNPTVRAAALGGIRYLPKTTATPKPSTAINNNYAFQQTLASQQAAIARAQKAIEDSKRFMAQQNNASSYGGGYAGVPAYQSTPMPRPMPPQTNLAQDFANMAGANNVYKGPLFSQVLPFYQAWQKLLPTVQQEGATQINPFIQRALGQQTRAYNTGLATTGGGRFGRGVGGVGSIQAEMERQRKSQLQDWTNTQQQGFQNLFYNPTEQAWNRAAELGQNPKTPEIPTWDQFTKQYGTGGNSTNF